MTPHDASDRAHRAPVRDPRAAATTAAVPDRVRRRVGRLGGNVPHVGFRPAGSARAVAGQGPGPGGPRRSQPAVVFGRRQSELCATCHTLTTEAFDADGNVVGSLPEQVPYQEWQHSAFVAEEVGCQSCHMPGGRDKAKVEAGEKNDPGWGSSRILRIPVKLNADSAQRERGFRRR